MATFTVTTQAELDAAVAKAKSADLIEIHGGSLGSPLLARGSSHVVAWGSSHVVARESSHVVARGSSHVVAWGSSHVVARESSHVVARESSHVVARESSHVEAWESSHVEAWESSHVVAWGSSHVVARESSHVVARGQVTVAVQSSAVEVLLFGFAVAVAAIKAKIRKRSRTCTVVVPSQQTGNDGWLDREGVAAAKGRVTLFKRVSADWKTQENTSNETLWSVGSKLEHPAWNPIQECGPGQFHACSRPYFCDEFRSTNGDRYVAISVAVGDIHATDNGAYPHKIAFRAGKVLHECNRFGEKI